MLSLAHKRWGKTKPTKTQAESEENAITKVMKKLPPKLSPPLANGSHEERSNGSALFLRVADDVTKTNLATILEQIEIKQVRSL